MIIITAGKKYLDIDAYASSIAYEILLNSTGHKSAFISTAKLNNSICPIIKNLNFKLNSIYNPNENDKFVVLDVSNPDFFDKIVNINKIEEVIDHHAGFADYWSEQGVKNVIEPIGSIATIIVERFIHNNRASLLTKDLCKLLLAAILDNTLNLKAKITTQRDIDVYMFLHKHGKIGSSFDKKYFMSCQQIIENDLINTIENDIKNEKVSDALPETFGQLLVYNKNFIMNKLTDIKKLFNGKTNDWLLNIICLADGKSYIYCPEKLSQKKIENLFNIKAQNDFVVLPKFLLRKEIMKKARPIIHG